MGKKNASSSTATSRGGKSSKRSRGSVGGGVRSGRGRNQYPVQFDDSDRRPESAVDDAEKEDGVSDACEGESSSSQGLWSHFLVLHYLSEVEQIKIEVPVAMWVSPMVVLCFIDISNMTFALENRILIIAIPVDVRERS
jgi:hypothetical protein